MPDAQTQKGSTGTGLPEQLSPDTQWSSSLASIISDLRYPSPSQILGTSSRFSEACLGRERDPREDPLGSGRIP